VTLPESLLQAYLNTEDPQYQEKRMVAQRNGKLAVQNFHVGTLLPHSFCAQVEVLYIDIPIQPGLHW
jgi:hypothetical protein